MGAEVPQSISIWTQTDTRERMNTSTQTQNNYISPSIGEIIFEEKTSTNTTLNLSKEKSITQKINNIKIQEDEQDDILLTEEESSPLSFEDTMTHSPIKSREIDDFGMFDRIGMGETNLSGVRDSILLDEEDADIDSEGEGDDLEGWEIPVPFDDSDEENQKKSPTEILKSPEEEDEEDISVRKSVIVDLGLKKQQNIDHILREMLTTEKTFVEGLDRVFKRYIIPLKRQSGVVNSNHIFSMFAKLGIIRNINGMFLKDLEKVISMNETNIDKLDEFSITLYGFSQTFKLYSDYVSGFNEFNLEISKMMTNNKKFSGFCERASKQLSEENSRIRDLPSFLITPIQRIPRLNLMMRDLLRIVGTDFKEHKNLAKAAKIIGDMAKYSNDKTKEIKNIQRIQELEKELGMKDLVLPHRKLIHECVLDRIRKSGKPLSSNILIFSDVIIIYPVKRPLDFTFTFFKEPYVVLLTDPKLKVRMIDETTMTLDYVSYTDNTPKNVMLTFDKQEQGMKLYNIIKKQIKKKRVVV